VTVQHTARPSNHEGARNKELQEPQASQDLTRIIAAQEAIFVARQPNSARLAT
jgi:hypothetical protein